VTILENRLQKKWGFPAPFLWFFICDVFMLYLLFTRSWRQRWRRLFLGSTWRLDRWWPQPASRWPRSNLRSFLQSNPCRGSLHNGVHQRNANAEPLSLKPVGHQHLDHCTLPRLNHDLVPRSNSSKVENVDLLVDGEHGASVARHAAG